MILRLIVGGTVLFGLVATHALALADSASARTFKGRTAQGHRIAVAVEDRKFKIKVFEADLRCRDGSSLLLEEGGFLWTEVAKKGSFRDSQFGKTDSVYFRGRLTEKRIRGRLRVTDELRSGVRCQSRWINFNATPR